MAKEPTAIVSTVRKSWNLLSQIPWPVMISRQSSRAASPPSGFAARASGCIEGSILDSNYAVGPFRQGWVMGHDHQRALLLNHSEQKVCDGVARFRVERAGRFISQDQNLACH